MDNKISVYIIAGDLFNRFDKTLEFSRQLQEFVDEKVQIRFLAGNHEMGTAVTYDELESSVDDLYFHNKVLDVGGTRLVGNNGWYDYSFDQGRHTIKETQRFKREFWYDRRIQQPLTDPERLAVNLEQMKAAVEAGHQAGQKVILVNHFSPEETFINQIPFKEPRLDILKSFLGSQAVSDMIVGEKVQASVSGHLHLHVPPYQKNETTFYNASVGYRTRRVKEWFSHDFMTEWKSRLVVFDV
ncbi:phosphohydrolase [Fructobacillus ficulneus]|uniref:Phosphohydrolase n=1 Tax=Fructobacillus ficulneus TaxID=157463 RepID=A0A0K8MHA9_9LACO|nr:phosphohydrolase [Fructobacillus ficulneus]